MKQSGTWKTWPAIIAAGIFYIFCLTYIIFLAFRITKPDFLTGILISWKETPFIVGAAILLIALFTAYARNFTMQNISGKCIFAREILFFILYFLILLLLITLSLRIIDNKSYLFTKVIIITLLFFLSIFPLIQMGNFLIRLFLYNFFYDRSQTTLSNDSHVYRILEYEDFQKHCLNTLNQCRRYKNNMGLLTMYLVNLDEVEHVYGPRGAGFLRKQFIFILSENARSYEPWGRTKGKDVLMNSLQVNNETELTKAEFRFRELIDRHIFTIFNKDIKPEIRLQSLFIETQKIQNTPENPDMKQLIQLIDKSVAEIRATK